MTDATKLTSGNDSWSGWFSFDDYVLALGGNDTLNGGGGNDRLYGGSGGDTIYGGDGSDILDGGDDLQTVTTDSDNSRDLLYGEAGNDILRGKAGNDMLDGGTGRDDLDGGDGNDTLFSTSVGNGFVLGVDTPDDAGHPDVGGIMDGGNGDDTIMSSRDFSGTMTVIGGDGNDTLTFGRDANVYKSNPTTRANTVDLEAQSGSTVFDAILVVKEIENIDAGDSFYNDVFRGDNGVNVLKGRDGDDRLEGRGGADTLDGGDGTDTADYASSFGVDVDLTRATQQRNDAQGDVLIDIENIDGSGYSDTLRGDSGANVLSGKNGGDVLEGRGGADTLNGGSGTDTASYESSAAAVQVTLGEPTTGAASITAGGDAAGDVLISIENLTGSDFGDGLVGNSLGNKLDGGDGNDTLYGLGGEDTLLGGNGADVIRGGDQNDIIDGGFGNDNLGGDAGIDTVSFESWDSSSGVSFLNETIRITLGEGNAAGSAVRTVFNPITGLSSTETDTLLNFENVRGSNKTETITGNSGVNVLEGRGGNDILIGGGGNDTLDGGDGVDTASYASNTAKIVLALGENGAGGAAVEFAIVNGQLTAVSTDTLFNIENVNGTAFNDFLKGNSDINRLSGGAGDDTIDGGGGDDTIVGGTETDIERLTGGTGHDTFVYLTRGDSFTTATHTGDIITDFNADEDLIDLRALHVNVADLKVSDFVDASGLHRGEVFEDLNHNNTFDANELNINIILSSTQTFSLQDVLV